MIDEGRLHLESMLKKIHQIILSSGRYFLHEHPATAASWQGPGMQDLMCNYDVYGTVPHQCEYGVTSSIPGGTPKPALTPTRWLSNSRHMITRLSRRCSKQHEHQQLKGGRTKTAEIYPVQLCVEILRGIHDTEDSVVHIDDDDTIALEYV